MTETLSQSEGKTRFVLLLLVSLAIIVRLLHWPGVHELRDGDELTYAWGSLQLLEGNLPGDHYVPAGFQTWVGWSYEGVVALKHFVRPDSLERRAPYQLRPFLAIDHTLFDAYRDTGVLRQVWILASFGCALGGVIAAFRLGLIKGGISGGIFMGGTMALLPLFVDFSVQARPYIVAWSFGVMALYYALASPRPKALTISAILMGLAIGSRVDMLMLLPLIWSEACQRERQNRFLRQMLRYHAILILSFLVVAPWYLMTLVACLRALGTIRGSTAGQSVAKPVAVFWQVIWEQGMLLHVALFLVAIALWIVIRPRRYMLAVYLLLIGLSVFKAAVFGLRHQGAPLILAAAAGTFSLGLLRRYSTIAATGLAITSLILPAVQTGRLITNTRNDYVPDFATPWIEQHVPPGTIVYLRPWIWNPLPTAEAADASWSEVTDSSAYARKFKSGMDRFGLTAAEIPRALSDVNLAIERANRRFLFILGTNQDVTPRYDTRVFESGPVFGVRDLRGIFSKTGGVVVLRSPAEDPIAQSLGTPTIAWLNHFGSGTRIYCSPDVTAKLR